MYYRTSELAIRALLAVIAASFLLAGCNLFRASERIQDSPDAVLDSGVPDSGVTDTGQPPIDMPVQVDAACAFEPDDEFCRRHGKNCGLLLAADLCGDQRSAMCGDCDSECGAVESNVCGCPCDIDGECRIPGERNPDSECLFCDPDTAADAWTADEGQACDDGNACSAQSSCDALGACLATDIVGCDAESTDCQIGSCDEATMACLVEPLPDDIDCTDDGLACTGDTCVGGVCGHQISSGFCVVDGVCFANGDLNPSNPCEACDSATSPTTWTATVGVACVDADSLACTSGVCDSVGACIPGLLPANCLISSTCRATGAVRSSNPCEICDPARSTTGWSPRAANTACADADGLDCTSGACNGSGVCTPVVDATSCAISGACVPAGATQSGNDCRVCDPADSNTEYSDVDDGTSCTAPLSCQSGSCDGGVCKTTVLAGFCAIAGACYAEGALNPANICDICSAALDASAWSLVPTGTECATGPTCTCTAAGQCVRSNGNDC